MLDVSWLRACSHHSLGVVGIHSFFTFPSIRKYQHSNMWVLTIKSPSFYFVRPKICDWSSRNTHIKRWSGQSLTILTTCYSHVPSPISITIINATNKSHQKTTTAWNIQVEMSCIHSIVTKVAMHMSKFHVQLYQQWPNPIMHMSIFLDWKISHLIILPLQ